MTWIRQDETADLPIIVRAASLLPQAAQAIYDLTRATGYGATSLTRTQEEAIATVVSVVNRCRY